MKSNLNLLKLLCLRHWKKFDHFCSLTVFVGLGGNPGSHETFSKVYLLLIKQAS
jgi:hypothetical protein